MVKVYSKYTSSILGVSLFCKGRYTEVLNQVLTMPMQFQDLINLAPRKPDWDLKRDVAKKLEKLERRTQKAIADLIRMYKKPQCKYVCLKQQSKVATRMLCIFHCLIHCTVCTSYSKAPQCCVHGRVLLK